MIFKNFCPSQIQNRIKQHPEYDSIINHPLKLTDAISQSKYKPIQATYPYISLTQYLAIIMNARQQEKEVLVEYMDRFKQEKITVKIPTGENNWIFLLKQLRNLRNFMKWMMKKEN